MQRMIQKKKQMIQCPHQEKGREVYDETGSKSVPSGIRIHTGR